MGTTLSLQKPISIAISSGRTASFRPSPLPRHEPHREGCCAERGDASFEQVEPFIESVQKIAELLGNVEAAPDQQSGELSGKAEEHWRG